MLFQRAPNNSNLEVFVPCGFDRCGKEEMATTSAIKIVAYEPPIRHILQQIITTIGIAMFHDLIVFIAKDFQKVGDKIRNIFQPKTDFAKFPNGAWNEAVIGNLSHDLD
ncbi:hypothetical protein AFLA_003470 [Aspergillus flavus NRRL3357]|nr:hypothetical protein AFLA_003470 [Aspergillus flavus NRRL3357]